MQINGKDFELERQLQTELWNFRKRFYYGEDREGYWEDLCKTVNELHEKYNSTFLDMVLLCNTADIENRWKEAMRDPFKDPDMLTTVYKRLMKERMK